VLFRRRGAIRNSPTRYNGRPAPSASADPLGLLADDSENPGIAWHRRNGGKHLVQCLGHDRRRRASPDTPGNRLVDQVGRGHRPDVGLPADALAEVRVRPHYR
jgi:hypothetical protein